MRLTRLQLLNDASRRRHSVASGILKHGLLSQRAGLPFPSKPRFHSSRYSGLLSSTPRHDAPRLTISASRTEPTIYALSTAQGRAAIAIVRISGSACLDVYRCLCPGKATPRPRYGTLRTLYKPNTAPSLDSILDSNALIFYYPSPHTATGEDVLELHVHGGQAVVKATLAAIAECKVQNGSLRYAEPGEFTRRAFTNNRLDLTQVEALGDVLSAATEQQRRLSVRGTTNTLSRRYETWRQQLLYARGELEALIDFSEDQHFDESPAELCASVSEQVQALQRILRIHSENAMRGELLRNGISLSLLGAPNAGKSSLLNHIIGRDAAIVSHEAGTTRDVVEVGLDLGGYFCRLSDTAGLREAVQSTLSDAGLNEHIGVVEKEGMRRAKERATDSDVVIVVLSFEMINNACRLHLDPEVVTTAAKLNTTRENVEVVVNKSDLSRDLADMDGAAHLIAQALPGIMRERVHFISCQDPDASFPGLMHRDMKPGEGNIQAFLRGLIRHFADLTAAVTSEQSDAAGDPSVWQDSLGASERHRLLLLQCAGHLDAFVSEVDPATPGQDLGNGETEADIVVAAEHLRAAADCLSKITGRGEGGDVEEVLGVVFEKFCVGK